MAALALLKPHRWHWVIPVLTLLAGAGVVLGSEIVAVPFAGRTVVAALLLGLVAIVVGLVPLYPVFGELELALIRERTLRVIRVLCAIAVVVPTLVLPGVVHPGTAPAADATLLLFLLAAGLVAVVVVGEFAWLPVLGLGFTALVVDTAPGSRVGVALGAIGVLPAVAAVAGAACVVAWRGARRVRL